MRWLALALVMAGNCGLAAAVSPTPSPAPSAASSGLQLADFRGESVSADVQHIADWAVHSGDHQRLPFIVVDKANAKAYAFDASGRLTRGTSVLLGMGMGDAFPPGVVDMNMSQTQPWQRITPAGRYFAEEDRNLKGQWVLWVDYDAGIAIHRLSSKRTAQKRHERIASPNPADHRITYGCINVPPSFYDQVVHPSFKRKGGVVYVLPDTVPLKSVFKSYDIAPAVVARRAEHNARHARPAAVREF